MDINNNKTELMQQKPLRLWPGVVIVVLMLLFRIVIPYFVPSDPLIQIGMLAGFLGGVLIFVWWAFFSRAARFERFGGGILMIAALVTTSFFLHESISTSMMGLMFIFYSLPLLSFAFVLWAVLTRNLSTGTRRATMVATILLASGLWMLLRTEGMDGSARNDFAWRWTKTAEERFLAQAKDDSVVTESKTAEKIKADWPGFRGANRDSIITGVKIETDWAKKPPVELWRRPVGPGCSSFAIKDNLFYTQEQLGEEEVVSCYELLTGKPVWSQKYKARFWDSHAGAGPRSTPTLANGRVYTLGGTGILNVLDAGKGTVIWSRNAAEDAGVKALRWGFSSSPLVDGDIVIVALTGKLAAYDKATGKPLWFGTDGKNSYSSPHLLTIDGVSQVLLMSQTGAISVEPKIGKQLWKYDWVMEDRILQPAVITGGELLLTEETKGVRRISVSRSKGEWGVKEIWTSGEMKLNFNDFIIHKGFAYGFDGPALACIDVKDGKRKWKGKPYRGWLLLLADQDVLLVLSEQGEMAVVEATPEKFIELGRFPAIKGKTWNHPAFAGGVFLARNSQEMAAFRLSISGK